LTRAVSQLSGRISGEQTIMMHRRTARDLSDLQAVRELAQALPGPTAISDLEERLLMPSIRENLCLWEESGRLAAFAFVDGYNNLNFEILPAARGSELEDALVSWAEDQMRERNALLGAEDTLDACFSPADSWQIALLLRNGFTEQSIRSLRYRLDLSAPPSPREFPRGFSWRPVLGEREIPDLVALHRAAFGTLNMTAEQRLAMMEAPDYRPDLDLVALSPEGRLAAFCVGGISAEEPDLGYTDPIGTRPEYQGLGLARALTERCLAGLFAAGVRRVRTGTSSENLPMQRLARSLGFQLESEQIWFSKIVGTR
jgi:ribosomal protein S18 acetylase RimI-like enzyme